MRLPTQEDWDRELAAGWDGPDGSSCSTDAIFGVTIGVTSASHEHCALAANLHDWRYRLGRSRGLSSEFRCKADKAYRDDCIRATDAALEPWWLRKLARGRAHSRYAALLSFGWIFFND